MTLRPSVASAAAFACLTAAAAPAAASGLCAAWSAPQRIGLLDTSQVSEASGMEWTPAHPDRLYHVNDSGDLGNLYVTTSEGTDAHAMRISGLLAFDTEDLSAGPCGESRCLFIADIGDNVGFRPYVRIAVVEEPAALTDSVPLHASVTATYPDGAHNAEAAAVHPRTGDLFVLTKGEDGQSRLYRLDARQIAAGGDQEFALMGTLDLEAVMTGGSWRRLLATGMDIAPDGSRFVVLTYAGAAEFALDLAAPDAASRLADQTQWRRGADFQQIATLRMPQAEAVAYGPDGAAILYETEASRGEAALARQTCLD